MLDFFENSSEIRNKVIPNDTESGIRKEKVKYPTFSEMGDLPL